MADRRGRDRVRGRCRDGEGNCLPPNPQMQITGSALPLRGGALGARLLLLLLLPFPLAGVPLHAILTAVRKEDTLAAHDLANPAIPRGAEAAAIGKQGLQSGEVHQVRIDVRGNHIIRNQPGELGQLLPDQPVRALDQQHAFEQPVEMFAPPLGNKAEQDRDPFAEAEQPGRQELGLGSEPAPQAVLERVPRRDLPAKHGLRPLAEPSVPAARFPGGLTERVHPPRPDHRAGCGPRKAGHS